jgi:hypothetical protein
MAARTIVTLHPDVECDVCGRRLLRGERPDVFLGGGQRHMVCELCTPRAAHEGWHREVEGQSAAPRAQRPQRGRSLLGRLRQLREPTRGAGDGPAGAVDEGHAEGAQGVVAHGPRRAGSRTHARAAEWAKMEPEWTALDEQWGAREVQPALADHPAQSAPAAGVPAAAARPAAEAPLASAPDSLEPPQGAPAASAGAMNADHDVLRALEIFNGGGTPRRIASVTRALGEACVHVARDAERESVVAVVVAWELCWYRYELDVEDATGEVRAAAEGTELQELPAALRVANALADEHGTLSLLAP